MPDFPLFPRLPAATVAVGLACATPLTAQILYDIVDLGTLNEHESTVEGINNSGQVAGTFTDENFDEHAYRYDADTDTMIDLGTLGGTEAEAYDINNNGEIVGQADTSDYGEPYHAFLYSNGNMIDLGTLSGDEDSRARAINDQGDLIGSSSNSYGYGPEIYRPSGGPMIALDDQFYTSDINNNRVIAGGYNTDDGLKAAIRTPDGTITTLPGFVAVTSGDTANAINDDGVVVGWARNVDNDRHAFVYENGTMTDLGTPDGFSGETYTSYAYDINAAGEIVGYFDGDGFYYDPVSGTMTALTDVIDLENSVFDNIISAYGINDQGWIIGEAYTNSGDEHGFLLKPVSAVPEPTTSALGFGAIAGLLVLIRRRRTGLVFSAAARQ